MDVITADDIKTSISTLQDAIIDLAHEVASMQNRVSELKIKKDSMDETLLEMERIDKAHCERWRRADPYPYTPLKDHAMEFLRKYYAKKQGITDNMDKVEKI